MATTTPLPVGTGKGQGAIKRQKKAQLELQVWMLRQRGYSEYRIADQLNVTPKIVQNILVEVENRILLKLSETVERIKVEQTYQLYHVLSEAMDAWEASKKGKKRKIVKTYANIRANTGKTGNIPGNPSAYAINPTNQVQTLHEGEATGDPQYLDIAMRALADVRKIWGIGQEANTDNLPAVVLPVINEINVMAPPGYENIHQIGKGNGVSTDPIIIDAESESTE